MDPVLCRPIDLTKREIIIITSPIFVFTVVVAVVFTIILTPLILAQPQEVVPTAAASEQNGMEGGGRELRRWRW